MDGRGPLKERTDCLDETIVFKFAEGSLPEASARHVVEHIAHCIDCRELVSWVRRDRTDLCEDTAGLAAAGSEASAIFAAMRQDRPDRTGELLAEKYRLGRRLGEGGMGVVYEAINTWTERRVALKLLHSWFSADVEIVERFRREAKSAGRIEHPSIVQVFDLGRDPRDGALYLVQEFLTGETLRQHLSARGRLPLPDAVATLSPIMDGLAAAHHAGVVHRDVKPENIILSTDSRGAPLPKLIDFGISKMADGAVMLRTERAVGTPLYMSPEQLRAAEEIDGRADIWAVGVVLFELLAGRRPFEAATPADATVQILSSDAPSLRSLVPELPEAVAQVVARALTRERERRFPTMRAMLEALTAAASSAGVVAPASGGSAAADGDVIADGDAAAKGGTGAVSPMAVTAPAGVVRSGNAAASARPAGAAMAGVAAAAVGAAAEVTVAMSAGRATAAAVRRRPSPVALVIALLALVAGVVAIARWRGHSAEPTATPAVTTRTFEGLTSAKPDDSSARPETTVDPSAPAATSGTPGPTPATRPATVDAIAAAAHATKTPARAPSPARVRPSTQRHPTVPAAAEELPPVLDVE